MCDDGISYPNKFARKILLNLPVDNLIFEYSPDWMPTNHRYDNYFEYNNKKYILEMDGAQHFEDTEWGTKEKQEENDNYKTKIAEQNGCNVIRINCLIPEYEYIKSNIMTSQLSQLFDLSQINFDECNKFATSSLVKEVSDFFMSHPHASIYEISDYFKIARCTIRKYLKQGASLGFCNYTVELSRKRSSYSISRSSLIDRGKNIYVYDSNKNFVGHYIGYKKCAEELNKQYPDTRFSYGGINSAINRHKTYRHKNFYFFPTDRKEDYLNGW